MNTYFVTLSYAEQDKVHYKPTIQRIMKKEGNLLVAFQKGKEGTHPHFHLAIQSNLPRNTLRARFRTYMKPIKPTKINLNIKKSDNIGKIYNYLMRDKTTKIVKVRGFKIEDIKKEAVKHPDPNSHKRIGTRQLLSMLVQKGYKYPERPGVYLKQIDEDGYDTHPYVTNASRLNKLLRFHFSHKAQDWDDHYIAQSNKNVLI